MAIPIILVETITITEFFILLSRNLKGFLKKINKAAGIIAGIYFLVITLHLLFKAVVPITLSEEWRTVIDVIAVGSYLLGVVPLMGIALLELGLIKRRKSEEWKLKAHAACVSVFLVVAHIAMIFGMLDPSLLGAASHLHHTM